MNKTDITDPDYFHKVVDCQYACPAHTNVPEYIRLIAEQRYTDAYMLNWQSNVFPGVLGRTCDRPCEPACRRGRLDEKPVAICRLKRVTADYKDDVQPYLPKVPEEKNGKRVALVGAGPASLTVARDLLPLGYEVHLFEKDPQGGGMMRSQIPDFRLPDSVLDEEVELITDMGVQCHYGVAIESLGALLAQGFDAVFVGSGAPRGRDLDIPGRHEAADNVHVGIDWLSSVSFGHVDKIGKRVVVVGGGNTAMDCCRTALRLGASEVTVTVRSGFAEMKASEWEKEDAMAEGIPILDFHQPEAFLTENGRLVGMRFIKVQAEYDDQGRRRLVPTGEPPVDIPCDDVLLAIGQYNAFPWIERDIGIEFDEWDMPRVSEQTMQSTLPRVFFGGDAAFGPKNIITAVAHGHAAAISIDLLCQGRDVAADRPQPKLNLVSQKMGVHEWSYGNDFSAARRVPVPHADLKKALASIKVEVELGFDPELAFKEAARCLNCDVETVFNKDTCIECDACVDICPMDCINFVPDEPEPQLREHLRVPAHNLEQAIYIDGPLATGRIMAKDEDVCLHCGLCAERCPTGAWDMQRAVLELPKAGAR